MNRRQIHTYQMLARVADFGATHAELFPKTTIVGELLAAIGSAVTKLSGHSSSQGSGNGAIRNSSGSRTAARKALKLAHIARPTMVLKHHLRFRRKAAHDSPCFIPIPRHKMTCQQGDVFSTVTQRRRSHRNETRRPLGKGSMVGCSHISKWRSHEGAKGWN